MQTGQGDPVNQANRDMVFQRLCVQMLQRTRPHLCPQGKRWQEAFDES